MSPTLRISVLFKKKFLKQLDTFVDGDRELGNCTLVFTFLFKKVKWDIFLFYGDNQMGNVFPHAERKLGLGHISSGLRKVAKAKD